LKEPCSWHSTTSVVQGTTQQIAAIFSFVMVPVFKERVKA